MKSQPQNPVFRNNSENFHQCMRALILCWILSNIGMFRIINLEKNNMDVRVIEIKAYLD